MKLLFKQRLFSWFDSYDIYDENGNTVYIVKGQLSWGHKLNIYNLSGEHIGTIKEEILAFLPKFTLYIGDRYVGEIKKELTFLRPKFHLNCKGWSIEGNYLEWDYSVVNSSNAPIMYASKQIFNLADTYEIDVVNPEDSIYALMIVLAIDVAKCSDN